MKAYADSSFIAALYLPERRSPIAAAFMERQLEALPFNPWHRLEVRNAIRLAVFHRVINVHQGYTQLKQLDADLRQRTLIAHMAIDWVGALREAEKLGAAHNQSIGCRSADLFHIAAAIEWGADHFLTFDDRQGKMARAGGLVVRN